MQKIIKELPKFEILFFIYAFALLMTPFLLNPDKINCVFFCVNLFIALVSCRIRFELNLEGRLYWGFFLLAAVVTVLAPYYIGETRGPEWAKQAFFLRTGIMVVANCYLIVSRCDAYKILRGLQYVSIPFGIWGIVEFLQRDNPVRQLFGVQFYGDWQVGMIVYRIRTLFYHPIIYGVFLVIVWCIFLYLPFRNKVTDILCKLLLILNLLATQSRSSWVSFCLVTMLYLIVWGVALIMKKEKLSKPAKSDKIIYAVMGIGGVGTVIWKWDFVLAHLFALQYRMQGVFTIDVELSTNKVRLVNIENVFRYMKELENPFAFWMGHGYGYGTIFMQEHPVGSWTEAIDNQYLTNLLDYGVIGLVLFLVLAFVLVVKYVKYGRKCVYGAGILAALSFMVSTFFYEGLSNMIPLMLFSSLLFLKKSNGTTSFAYK